MFDPTLHLLVPADPALFPRVEAAVAGGVTVVQLREKAAPDRRTYLVGKALAALVRRLGAAFVVNDRPDLALLLEADGLHLGQDDLPPDAVRRLLPAGMVLGLSSHTLDEALAAARHADYVAFGPIFGTRSKADPHPATGLDALAAVTAAVHRPVVAIGGITPERAPAVYAAGAAGVAVISAILDAPDPRAAARSLLPPARSLPVE